MAHELSVNCCSTSGNCVFRGSLTNSTYKHEPVPRVDRRRSCSRSLLIFSLILASFVGNASLIRSMTHVLKKNRALLGHGV